MSYVELSMLAWRRLSLVQRNGFRQVVGSLTSCGTKTSVGTNHVGNFLFFFEYGIHGNKKFSEVV